jgi:FHA domain-containing protein
MLTLTVISVNNAPSATPIAAHFGPQGGTIGRNAGVTLVLPDEARTISRQQANIRFDGQRYFFDEHGANASTVNGVSVGAGKSAALNNGDMLAVGPYVLRVTIAAATPAPVAPTPAAAMGDATRMFGPAERPKVPQAPPMPQAAPAMPAAPMPASASVADPLAADPFGFAPAAPAQRAAASADPFADLFGTPSASAPSPASDPLAAHGATLGTAPVPSPAASFPPGSAIPEDFDPFASGTFKGHTPAQPEALSLGTPADDQSNIDKLFGLSNSTSSNPLDALPAVPPGSTAAGPGAASLDPLALFGGPAAGSASALDALGSPASHGIGPAAHNHTPEIHSAFTPPRVQAPTSPPAAPTAMLDDIVRSVAPSRQLPTSSNAHIQQPVSYSANHGTASADQQALISALAEGLGSPLNLPQGLTEEFMFRMGGLVKEAVQGTIDLLAARAVSKREVKANATMIMERNNNPLKFSSDARSALLFLLSGQLDPAFMPPIAAMRDAHNDLRSHQFGVMAGMRAALEGVLDRFTPEELEKRLTTKGVLDSLIPATRKAKLWDLYTEMYKEIAREASDNFHKLYGQAFVKAYEEQVALLKQQDARH